MRQNIDICRQLRSLLWRQYCLSFARLTLLRINYVEEVSNRLWQTSPLITFEQFSTNFIEKLLKVAKRKVFKMLNICCCCCLQGLWAPRARTSTYRRKLSRTSRRRRRRRSSCRKKKRSSFRKKKRKKTNRKCVTRCNFMATVNLHFDYNIVI